MQERLDKNKSFSELIENARKIHRRFDKNWKKFSNDWPWVGYYVLEEREKWPLLVSCRREPSLKGKAQYR
jgi:hypothetical protein